MSQRDAAEQQEIADAVAAFKARLEPKWSDFFDLCFVQSFSYPEIATKLSVSRLRCKYMKKVLVARARKNRRLMETLDRWSNQEVSGAP